MSIFVTYPPHYHPGPKGLFCEGEESWLGGTRDWGALQPFGSCCDIPHTKSDGNLQLGIKTRLGHSGGDRDQAWVCCKFMERIWEQCPLQCVA